MLYFVHSSSSSTAFIYSILPPTIKTKRCHRRQRFVHQDHSIIRWKGKHAKPADAARFSGLLTDHNRMSSYIGLSYCGLVGRSEVCNKVTADVGTVSGILWHVGMNIEYYPTQMCRINDANEPISDAMARVSNTLQKMAWKTSFYMSLHWGDFVIRRFSLLCMEVAS